MTHLFEEIHLSYPFWRYGEAFEGSEHVFLLDSAKSTDQLGQFSFIGAEPFLLFSAKRSHQSAQTASAIQEIMFKNPEGNILPEPIEKNYSGNPIEALSRLLQSYALPQSHFQSSPIPFKGGAVGYFAYEAGYFIETLPDLGMDDLMLPDIYFGFYDVVLCHDHQQQKTFLSVTGRGSSEASAQQALQLKEEVLAQMSRFEASLPPVLPLLDQHELPEVAFRSHFGQAEYAEMIETCLAHIGRGDVYEICLTHRLEADYEGDGWQLYQNLRHINPAPFACYMRFPGVEIICSSPERFLKLDENRVAESRPIKGTRPRGSTPEEDQSLRDDLGNSEKDRAENVMIVDLIRNDLGRVCEVGSVHVPDLFVVEQYATVFQLVSTIRGTLKAELDALDLVKATFPGGSMTGAPKIEAMKIIDRLESVKRGIYSGAIGYLSFDGKMDLNIAIRSIVLQNETCYFNVGGAVVADSDPAAEYQETLDKAVALKKAIRVSHTICQKTN